VGSGLWRVFLPESNPKDNWPIIGERATGQIQADVGDNPKLFFGELERLTGMFALGRLLPVHRSDKLSSIAMR